jgi:hypothetical protein
MSNLSDLLGGAAGANLQEFGSTGTWTKPPGAKFITVEVWGGGGGGQSSPAPGSPTAFAQSGGGGGGYMTRTYTADQLSATEPVVVGAGGVSGGGSGGQSTFAWNTRAGGGFSQAGGYSWYRLDDDNNWGSRLPLATLPSGPTPVLSYPVHAFHQGGVTIPFSPVFNGFVPFGLYGGGAGGSASAVPTVPFKAKTGTGSIYGGAGGGGGAGGSPPTFWRPNDFAGADGGSQTYAMGGGGLGNPALVAGDNATAGVNFGDGGGGGRGLAPLSPAGPLPSTPGKNGAIAGGGGGAGGGAPGGKTGGAGGAGYVKVYTW